MKFLITGGAGFIGSYLSKKIAKKGNDVIIIDNLNNYYDENFKKARLENFLKNVKYKFYNSDIINKESLNNIFKIEKPDIIIHLAAMVGVRYSLKNPKIYEKVNIAGSINLLELSVKYNIKKFLYASTSSVYGGNKIPFKESDPTENPLSPYAATKKSLELLANVYNNVYNLNVAGLRFFTVYGPWGRPDMAYFKFFNNISKGKPITVYNKGEMSRDFTYIDDIISGIMKILATDFDNEIYNIGGSKIYKLMDFIQIIESVLNKKAKIIFKKASKAEVIKTQADNTKLKNLDWEPKTDLALGLEKFSSWFKNKKY